jgi:hypothetical protein
MKVRNGFVSNSSSSSFIVAYKKGESLQSIVSQAGMFKDFAEKLVGFVSNKIDSFESVQNIAIAMAKRDYGNPETVKEVLADGEYDWIVNRCKSLVDNPDDWFFGYGWASYNEGNDAIELLIGNGGLEVKSDMFILSPEGC